MSLESGVTATEEYSLNCEEAENVGKLIHSSIDEKDFGNITVRRNDKVRTLVCLKKPVDIKGEEVHIKPIILFSRLSLQVQNEEERVGYFENPLTAEPAPLFLDGRMRKSDKSILRNKILKIEDGIEN